VTDSANQKRAFAMVASLLVVAPPRSSSQASTRLAGCDFENRRWRRDWLARLNIETVGF